MEKKDEKESLKTLCSLEDLAGKKAMIYSRLLMDTGLAKDMEELATRHEKRKAALEKLLYGKSKNKQSDGAGTR